MRLGQDLSLAALKAALAYLIETPSPNSTIARLFEFARVLFEDPTLSTTYDAVVKQRNRWDTNVQQSVANVWQGVRDEFTLLSDSLDQVLEDIKSRDLNPGGTASLFVESFSQSKDGIPLRDWLRNLETGGPPDKRHLPAIASRLDELSGQLHSWFGGCIVPDTTKQTTERFSRVAAHIRTGLTETDDLESIRAALTLDHRDKTFRQFYKTLSDSLSGAELPRLPIDKAGLLQEVKHHAFEYLQYAERITALIEQRLAHAQAKQHVLNRMRSFFEDFDRARLDGELQKRRSEKKRLEDFLQNEIDRFVFSEGLYPIVHAEAAGGSFDQFIPAAEHRFSRAINTHQVPLLIELKQLIYVDPDKSKARKDLRELADKALSQAQTYSSHMKSNPDWAGHDVVALVIYGGRHRFRTTRPNIELIYLGDATPHEYATDLDAP